MKYSRENRPGNLQIVAMTNLLVCLLLLLLPLLVLSDMMTPPPNELEIFMADSETGEDVNSVTKVEVNMSNLILQSDN